MSPAKKADPKHAKTKRQAASSGRFVSKEGAAKAARTTTHSRSGKVLKNSPAVTKARKTITLDANVLLELESRGGSVSAQINEFVKQGLEWESRQAQIFELVAEYEAAFGLITEEETEEWEKILA